jgi:hypothetical protein
VLPTGPAVPWAEFTWCIWDRERGLAADRGSGALPSDAVLGPEHEGSEVGGAVGVPMSLKVKAEPPTAVRSSVDVGECSGWWAPPGAGESLHRRGFGRRASS